MSTPVPFTKYSATGNDFILMDNRSKRFIGDERALLQSLCARRSGIGADGILMIEHSNRADCAFKMRYFNRDGGEAEMCGNGACASAYHAASHGLAPAKMSFEVRGEPYDACVSGNRVRLRLQPPRDLQLAPGVLDQTAGTKSAGLQEGGFVNTGVPHYVVFVNSVDRVDVESLGRELRQHPAFSPAGANVDFVEITRDGCLKLRTYERGVEAETLACGTGAVAAALIAHTKMKLSLPLTLITPGGRLRVLKEAVSDHLLLEGEVRLVYTGQLTL